MVKSILTDVELDTDSLVSCVEPKVNQIAKENSVAEYHWSHGAGRKKKRLPKKGRKKSSVFINQVFHNLYCRGNSLRIAYSDSFMIK